MLTYVNVMKFETWLEIQILKHYYLLLFCDDVNQKNWVYKKCNGKVHVANNSLQKQ